MIAEARTGVGAMPNFTIVSFPHGGLTALMRNLRGISSAAAHTKPSRPALTIDTDALPGIFGTRRPCSHAWSGLRFPPLSGRCVLAPVASPDDPLRKSDP